MKLTRSAFAIAIALISVAAAATISYKVTLDIPARSIAVSMTIPNAAKDLVVSIPAWCPGFYFPQNYEKKIYDMHAVDEAGAPIQTTSNVPRSWKLSNELGANVTINYRVLGDDSGLGFFGVFVSDRTAFINGPAAFLYIHDRKEEVCEVTVNPAPDWEVACALEREGKKLVASDYDELVDSPMQMGGYTKTQFETRSKKFELIWVPPARKINCDVDEQTEVLRKVVEPILDQFGGARFKRYVFIIHLSDDGFGGGLEHRASTVLAVPNRPHLDLADLGAHEFFHAYNVKQIRPRMLGPFDYASVPACKSLWFCEGVTDYYAKLAVFRSGLQDVRWLLDQIAIEIATLESSRNALRFTLEEACAAAPKNGGFGIGDLNYYNKGFVVGLLLDASLRGLNNEGSGLDDVMRHLYANYTLAKPGYTDDDLRSAICGGKSQIEKLYDTLIRSKGKVAYEALRAIGLRLLKPGEKFESLGYSDTNGIVSRIEFPNSPLRIGDRVVNQSRVEGESSFTITVSRNGSQFDFRLPIVLLNSERYQLVFDPFANGDAKARREWYMSRGQG